MTEKPRVMLVEDHHLVADGMASLLSDTVDVVASVDHGSRVLAAARQYLPDLILLDLNLPGRSGLELIGELRAEVPECRILVVTMQTERVWADATLNAGAQGFVPKDAGTEELKVAISEVMAGRRFLSSLVPRRTSRTGTGPQQLGLNRLTPRQQEVVRLIGDGLSSAEIAEQLNLTVNTVAFHRKRIRQSLGIDSELGLVRYALLVQVGQDEKASDQAE
ncbi:MAG TPA: response regulator transcription factor [Gemmatimonadales bacterium]|nr:response regulator transcription factor [Gemmatimonadales bacterium]